MELLTHNLSQAPWLDWLGTATGKLAFIPLYALWVTLLLPGVWASMVGGLLYGTWLGSALVFAGACLGAIVVFLLSRTRLREPARHWLARSSRLQALEQAVTQGGLRLVLLTRLSPAFPFSLLNMAYGLSDVSFRNYAVGLIGILPGTVLFCSLGAAAGDLAKFGDVLAGEADPFAWALRLVGLLATGLVVLLVSRSIRQTLEGRACSNE